MDVWILDKERNKLGLIDTYQSLIWTRRYFALGDFELVVPATNENLQMLRSGNFVAKGVGEMVCRIESVDIKTDAQNGDWLIVKGNDCREILNQRVNLLNSYNENKTAAGAIYDIINTNLITVSQANREIDGIDFDDDTSTSFLYPSIVPYSLVFDYVSEICQQCGYGSEMVLDTDETTLLFRLYEGLDRSLSQNVNPPVVFTEELDNLAGSEYTESYEAYKNACYITGEGDGVNRQVGQVDLGVGIDRYEMYVDGKGVQKGSLNSTQYGKALQQFGVDQLQSCHVVVTFTGQVIDNTHKFGTDYDLGDIVTIYNKLGMAYDARITQVIESDDTQNGHVYIPTIEVRRATILVMKAQAVLGVNGTLYFTYGAPYAIGDNIKSTIVSAVYDVPTTVTGTGSIPWYDGSTYRSDITAVEFDSSFAEVQLTTLAHFFNNLRYVASFSGTQYLDLSQCISMASAFANCGRLVSSFAIDVSGWDVSNVSNFANCFTYVGYSATYVWAINGLGTWDVSNARTMQSMFAYAGYSLTLGTNIGWYGNMLNGWNTAKVTNMVSMFDNFAIHGAYNLNLIGWNVSNVGSNHNNFNRNATSQITAPHWVA